MTDVKQHWEERYGQRDRIWSGHVNRWLAEIVAPLTPGRALDLGCGEGGDSLWLAEHGWDVVGVDISETALGRAAEEAGKRGLTERVRFVQTNLSESFPEGVFDLVSAQFLQSMVHLDRERIFAAATRALTVGGVLIVVDHAAAPPWADEHAHEHRFLGPDEELAELALPDAEWEIVIAETRTRAARGPDGEPAVLDATVVLLRRR